MGKSQVVCEGHQGATIKGAPVRVPDGCRALWFIFSGSTARAHGHDTAGYGNTYLWFAICRPGIPQGSSLLPLIITSKIMNLLQKRYRNYLT